MLLRQGQAQQPELRERRPKRGGVADRVVLQLAREIEAAVPCAGATHRVTQEFLLGREVHVHGRCSSPQRCSGCQDSPRRVQGLSSAVVGTATRAVYVGTSRPSAGPGTAKQSPPPPGSPTGSSATAPPHGPP